MLDLNLNLPILGSAGRCGCMLGSDCIALQMFVTLGSSTSYCPCVEAPDSTAFDLTACCESCILDSRADCYGRLSRAVLSYESWFRRGIPAFTSPLMGLKAS